MLQRAQDMYKNLQERVKNTLNTMADLAEAVGVPPALTSLIVKREEENWAPPAYQPSTSPAPAEAQPAAAEAPAPEPKPAAKQTRSRKASGGNGRPTTRQRTNKKRPLEGNRERSANVRPLHVDDAINNSTYLARIIWSLGVAHLEGLGPLRPADIARMVMARSPVSLEPPNVARYIRRSKPTCITVAHTEGSSNFYKLNAQGKKLFEETFGTSLN